MTEYNMFKAHPRMPKKVRLADITVRDGFQHEESWIPTEAKIYYLQELAFAGVKKMEVTNLGNPRIMPQFKDADELLQRLRSSKRVTHLINDVSITAVTIRERAIDRAISLSSSWQTLE